MNAPQPVAAADSTGTTTTPLFVVAMYWLFVALPLAWGVYHTALQATQLFR